MVCFCCHFLTFPANSAPRHLFSHDRQLLYHIHRSSIRIDVSFPQGCNTGTSMCTSPKISSVFDLNNSHLFLNGDQITHFSLTAALRSKREIMLVLLDEVGEYYQALTSNVISHAMSRATWMDTAEGTLRTLMKHKEAGGISFQGCGSEQRLRGARKISEKQKREKRSLES